MLDTLIDQFGDTTLLMGIGACVGLIFGAAAARSRFCLRAATVELAEGRAGPRLAVWLVAFFSALACVQLSILAGIFDPGNARQLASTGSLSGAVIGGALFGIGMVMGRGCASRLLVLSTTGNLRAIITGLVLSLTAQASLRGVLAPVRDGLAEVWTISGGTGRNLMDLIGLQQPMVALLACIALAGALVFAKRRQLGATDIFTAFGVGVAVYLGWQLTYVLAQNSFEIIPVQSVTFTGPSTDMLMALVNTRTPTGSFGLGLVPGVFLGALVTALLSGDARIQRFGADTPMERYLVGGILMGFGSMLAGGCAVGAGMTGGAILALTAWVVVFFMWMSAMATHHILNRRTISSTA